MTQSARTQQWQLEWHEILNDYPDPEGASSSTPKPLPDMDHDFRLHFNMWQVPAEARQRAFAIFPVGNEMLARVDQHLSADRKPLEAEQAIALLRAGLRLARDAGWGTLPRHDLQIDILSEADIRCWMHSKLRVTRSRT